MALSKLYLPVDKEGYSVKFGENVISTKLDGGASRFRLDMIGATHEIPVQWSTDRAGYDYLMAFKRTTIKNGSLPFLIDLVVDDNEPAEYTAYLVPGTLGLRNQSGNSYIVGATLEVLAVPTNETADQAIIDAYLASIGES